MKVILRQNYNKLGNIGDVVDVKNGFARNYLIPRSIAFRATEGNLNALEQEKKQLARKEEKVVQDSEKLAAQLGSVSLTITMKVGEDDKLFGAVTSQMIAESLTEKGYTIDKRIIELEEPIKTLGIFEVPVKLHTKVSAKVKVWVVRE
ncbi:MAG: 50S ribosomal protein L9 [Bacteroidetes bacterium]|jgi:large subunit ribosomal protein L9|nr:50S ribosomal protein L9 [Bacteroidota bacterium]